MFCRMCLRRNGKVYYKLNNTYIDSMRTTTGVKMKFDDLVCCFCLATLRKIEKFTEMVKEADSILKQSIKTEEDVNEVNKYYNLAVSAHRNISIECSRALYETYACNIRDELLRQVERDLVKLEETEDEPHQLLESTVINNETDSTSDVPSLTVTVNKEEQNESTAQNDAPLKLSEDTFIDNGTDSTSNVPLLAATVLKEEQNESADQNDEPHQLPEDTVVDNETDSEDDVPRVTLAHISGDSGQPLHETCDDEATETKGGYILKSQRRVDEDICLIDQPREDRSAQQPTFNNDITNEPSNSKEEYNEHKLNEKCIVDTTLAASDEPLSCDICAYRSSSKTVLSSHIRAHTEAVSPEQLKRTSYREENSKAVTKLAREEVVDRKITRKRRNKLDINDVLTKEISKLNYVDTIFSSYKPFSCETCAFRTSYKFVLTRHLSTHAGEKPFACNICSYKCSQKSHLKNHLTTHTGEKPFACNICSYKCSSKSDLNRHLTTHTGEKPFACNICSYKCRRKSRLNIHLTTHTGEKPFACNICSYKCSHKGDLKKHLTTHTGEKPFACNICSYKCSRKSNLKCHLTTHTDEKPFACNTCSYKCSLKSRLNIHLTTHTDEKPFACNICSYKCSRKSYLKKHLTTHTGDKPFACNICSYKCSRKSSLKRHLKSHSGERPFSCDVCAHKTKSKRELKSHLFSSHVL